MLPGRVPTRRNTCLSSPRLAVPPQHTLSGSESWGSLPLGGTPGFCLVGLRKSMQCYGEPWRVWRCQVVLRMV